MERRRSDDSANEDWRSRRVTLSDHQIEVIKQVINGRTEDNGNSFKVGWGDKALNMKGPLIILVFILIASGGLSYQEHRELRQEIRTLVEEQQLNSYILSLPEDQRPKLKPPLSLFKNRMAP